MFPSLDLYLCLDVPLSSHCKPAEKPATRGRTVAILMGIKSPQLVTFGIACPDTVFIAWFYGICLYMGTYISSMTLSYTHNRTASKATQISKLNSLQPR